MCQTVPREGSHSIPIPVPYAFGGQTYCMDPGWDNAGWTWEKRKWQSFLAQDLKYPALLPPQQTLLNKQKSKGMISSSTQGNETSPSCCRFNRLEYILSHVVLSPNLTRSRHNHYFSKCLTGDRKNVCFLWILSYLGWNWEPVHGRPFLYHWATPFGLKLSLNFARTKILRKVGLGWEFCHQKVAVLCQCHVTSHKPCHSRWKICPLELTPDSARLCPSPPEVAACSPLSFLPCSINFIKNPNCPSVTTFGRVLTCVPKETWN